MSNNNGKNRICQIIDEKKSLFTDASDKIWGFAETRFQLTESADVLCRVLEDEGFEIQRGCGGMEDAFIASYGSGKPVIGILAEYDALGNLNQEADLPEKKAMEQGKPGHGCGHNALGAGALAGATGIKEYMKENNISGTVRLYGCPAEESGSGKAFMARAGLFNGLDAILSWHPMNETAIWGFSSLANYQVYFNFKGISAHAASSPELGRSALDAVELMSMGVNYLREHVIQEARIHYAYIDAGGTSPNVVQPTASVLYFIRAPRSSQVQEIFERVVDVAKGAALMTGTTMELQWDSACAEYIVNDTLGKVMYDNMRYLGNPKFTKEDYDYAEQFTNTLTDVEKNIYARKIRQYFPHKSNEEAEALSKKSMMDELVPYFMTNAAMAGSTDVGDASWHAPTAQMTTACYPAGTSAHSWQYVACGKSDAVHNGLLYAGKVIAMTALDVLTDPDMLKKAQEEYKKQLGGESYHCPIPAEVQPK